MTHIDDRRAAPIAHVAAAIAAAQDDANERSGPGHSNGNTKERRPAPADLGR